MAVWPREGSGEEGICTPKVYIKNQKSALLLIPASASLYSFSSFSADFDWTLYLGLAFITAVCFAFGAALVCCARRGIRANPHYNMARSGKSSTRTRRLPPPPILCLQLRQLNLCLRFRFTVMDADYMPGVVDKKEMRMHIEAANLGYDYVNPGHRYLPGEHIMAMGVGVGVGCGIGGVGVTEHHYDVPNLAAK